jgi:hypothetical protein
MYCYGKCRVMTEQKNLFSNDNWAQFYNIDAPTTFSLTTDIDWAPDYAIEDVFGLVEASGFSLTAFATHPSTILKAPPKWLEIGLHPDFTRPDPQHGISRKILELKELYPNSIGVRAHRNVFGQNIAHLAREAKMTYDASVLLWVRPWCQIFRDQFGLVRMCYNWEDGVHADMGLDWSLSHVPISGPGLKIFNIHPIFIYLNCPNDDYRRDAVRHYRDLQNAPERDLKPLIYKGYGARSFLIDLLAKLKDDGLTSIRLDSMANHVSTSQLELGN